MPSLQSPPAKLRAYRNSALYRSLARTFRVYNRMLVDRIHASGFEDFSPAFPSMLANLDTEGARIGVLAARAGVSRQAAGQLLREIERCGYVRLSASTNDARATVVRFTARGGRLLARILVLVKDVERDFASMLDPGDYDRLRKSMLRIADRIDPGGALGVGDAEGDA